MMTSSRHHTVSLSFEPAAKTSQSSEIEKRSGRDTARVPHGRHSRSRMAAEFMRIFGELIVHHAFRCDVISQHSFYYFRYVVIKVTSFPK